MNIIRHADYHVFTLVAYGVICTTKSELERLCITPKNTRTYKVGKFSFDLLRFHSRFMIHTRIVLFALLNAIINAMLSPVKSKKSV